MPFLFLIVIGLVFSPLHYLNIPLKLPKAPMPATITVLEAEYGIVEDYGFQSKLYVNNRELIIPKMLPGAYTNIRIGNGELSLDPIN